VRFLALGARACLMGRAWAWAVAAQGEAGVRHLLRSIAGDIDVALALTGVTDVADLDRDALVSQPRG
jgi:L-lactate dehydrogenase (cytochrome)